MPSIAITSNCRISLIIFSLSPHAKFPRMGGRKSCADQEAARKVPRAFARRVYQYVPKSAPFRIKAALYRIGRKALCAGLLSSYRDAQSADVTAGIKGP